MDHDPPRRYRRGSGPGSVTVRRVDQGTRRRVRLSSDPRPHWSLLPGLEGDEKRWDLVNGPPDLREEFVDLTPTTAEIQSGHQGFNTRDPVLVAGGTFTNL